MEFDYTYNGAADWNFPSPTATPTSAAFNHNFNTPKTATFPSHFQDAFSTPQIPGYATPGQPEYASMTPVQSQQTSSDVLRHNYYAGMHASGGSVNAQAMPPPNQAGHPGQLMSPMYTHSQATPALAAAAMSFDTSQIQTPPPTRGTAVKKPTPSQLIAFGTPSTIASRRFMSPQQVPTSEQHRSGPQYTPMQYPQLQFSPSVYQFSNMGPASAPVFPQTQIMWDQTASSNMYNNAQQPVLDDPFAPVSSQAMVWPAAQVQHTTQSMSFDTPAMTSFPVQAPMQRPASAAPHSSTQAPPPAAATIAASVDPSLVYSSPMRPAIPPTAPTRQTKLRSAPKVEPKRNDSAAGLKKQQHQRTETASSADATPTSASKDLRRSNTTGAVRPQSAHPSISMDSVSRSNSMLQASRTASPLKRVGKLPLGSISETKKPKSRASVILTIDETGRARTETRHVGESVTDSMQSTQSTQSIRDRYPGLFDSDSSDAESEPEDQTPSRSASFSFKRGEERKSKAARLDPPVENLDGLSIPRSSSSASMNVAPSRAAIAAAAQLRRGGSLRAKIPSRNGQRRTASCATTSIDTAPMDMSMSEQRQSVTGAEDSFQGQHRAGDPLEAHNRRWSIMSMEQQWPQSVSPTHQYPDIYALANTRLPVQQGPQIRCSCGVTDGRGQALVQCQSCTQWLHSCCAGLNPHAPPPPFTCFLCTKPAIGLQMSQFGGRSHS